MFRTAPSRLLRAAAIPTRHPTVVRRTLTTATPARRSRSWKSSAIRWGIAIAGVYYYSTSNAFADEPAYLATAPPSTEDDSSNLPTIEEITAQSKRKLAAAAGEKGSQPEGSVIAEADFGSRSDGPQTPEEYEEEAESQGAFNPETGEINWDCPCLGGMAHGPCGEQFRAAFSCFVYSTEEPKGMDCIDKFKTMQDCFREHPDVYGSELEDEVEEEARQHDADAAKAASLPSDSTQAENTTPPSAQLREGEPEKVFTTAAPGEERIAKKERAQSAKIQVKGEAEELVPKKWHDTEKSNEGK